MAVLSIGQAGAALARQGMPARRIPEFVAVAMAESSLDTEAKSPVGALGLWQIMPFNFAGLGLDIAFWDNPDTNARAAVLLSGSGTNCAAWDTCYANIAASGRYRFLGWPETGSAAFNNLPAAASGTGYDKAGFGASPAMPTLGLGPGDALAQVTNILTRQMPVIRRLLLAERMVTDRMYTAGWRP